MGERVLGYLAGRFTVSDENIASEALTWVLGRSGNARHAVISIAREAGAELPEDLTFVGQVGNPDTGRPDIVASDAQGQKRLLVEAKFGAALTPNQPNSYLNSLPANLSGALLVVAPERRLPSLWVELLREAVPDAPAPSSFEPDESVLKQVTPVGPLLALTSWRYLLDRVHQSLETHGENVLARDVDQIQALAARMDQRAFTPTTPSDLDVRTGRLIHQLERIIDATHDAAAQSPIFYKAGTASHGRIFYGWYLRSRKSGRVLWFGFLPRAWDLYGISPLWVQLKTSDNWSRQRLLEALAPMNTSGGPGLFEDSTEAFLIPLTIPTISGT